MRKLLAIALVLLTGCAQEIVKKAEPVKQAQASFAVGLEFKEKVPAKKELQMVVIHQKGKTVTKGTISNRIAAFEIDQAVISISVGLNGIRLQNIKLRNNAEWISSTIAVGAASNTFTFSPSKGTFEVFADVPSDSAGEINVLLEKVVRSTVIDDFWMPESPVLIQTVAVK